MSATDRLIDETLRLDGEATKGPWVRSPHDESGSIAALIASYRTAAPRLARMLRVAMTELVNTSADATLAEIEKIAKEEA